MSESVDALGVVGAESGAIADAIAATDRAVSTLSPAAAVDASVDTLVVVGERALLDIVAVGVPDCPVLPVETGVGVRSVAREDVAEALAQVSRGEATPLSYPVLDVDPEGGDRTRALLECMLVTAEPARISEYGVESDGAHVDTFRADGVVVATPAGTHGYARRVDAPVVAPGSGVVAIAPVAPFATHADHWVCPCERVQLTVERNEEPVHLLADDRTVGPIEPGVPVVVTRGATVTVLTVPQSSPPFPDRDR